MTYTLKIEVKAKEIKTACQLNWYTPAVDWSTKFPRTEKGIVKALEAMKVQADKEDWIESYQFKLYKGKVMYYTPNPELIAKLDKKFNQI